MFKKFEVWEEWLKPYLELVEVNNRFGTKTRIWKIVKEIPFEEAIKNNLVKNSRAVVFGNCIECNNKFHLLWRKITRRKHSGGKQVCNKCALKYATNTKEWKNTNSKAQLIAQNRPEVKKRMSESVKKSRTEDVINRTSKSMIEKWKDEGYVKRQRKAHLEGMERAFNNPESCYKMTHKNRFYTGWYNSKWGKIYFGSSWELAFIVHCESNVSIKNLERCKDWIKYKDEFKNKRKYNPDFKIETDSEKYVVEVKGSLDLNNLVQFKSEAAKNHYVDVSYCLYVKRDLVRMGAIKSNHNAKKYCEQYKDKIENLNEGGLLNGKS